MPSRTKIGVLGGAGNLGSDLVGILGERHVVQAITKENYDALRGARFDVLVNANGNSRRFWANQNPLLDFEASTVSVYRSTVDFSAGLYIYVSSSDVYPDHGDPSRAREDASLEPQKLSPYGFHKYVSEMIVRRMAARYVILRSAMILGRRLKKGPIFDILNGTPLFVSHDSRLQLITTRAFAETIEMLLASGAQNEVLNVGGRGAFDLAELGKYFSETIVIHSEAERQIYEMSVEKLSARYPLKTSVEYLLEFLHEREKRKKADTKED